MYKEIFQDLNDEIKGLKEKIRAVEAENEKVRNFAIKVSMDLKWSNEEIIKHINIDEESLHFLRG